MGSGAMGPYLSSLLLLITKETVIPQYSKSEYRKIKSLVSSFKSYVLKAEEDIYIDGSVEKGNVAGFINNSIGREEKAM